MDKVREIEEFIIPVDWQTKGPKVEGVEQVEVVLKSAYDELKLENDKLVDANKHILQKNINFRNQNTCLLSALEKAVKALDKYRLQHDSSCSLSFSNECDCDFPLLARQTLKDIGWVE